MAPFLTFPPLYNKNERGSATPDLAECWCKPLDQEMPFSFCTLSVSDSQHTFHYKGPRTPSQSPETLSAHLARPEQTKIIALAGLVLHPICLFNTGIPNIPHVKTVKENIKVSKILNTNANFIFQFVSFSKYEMFQRNKNCIW